MVSAADHSAKVDNHIVFLDDRSNTITVSNNLNLSINVHSEEFDKLKDETAWLYLISETGFAMKVSFTRSTWI